MASQNVELVRKALSAFASRDVHTLLDLHAPDFESIPAPAAQRAGVLTHRGHAMMREWWERAWGAGDIVDYRESDFVDAPPHVVLIARGTVHRQGGGVHRLFIPTVYTISDGKLSRARVFESEDAAYAAVGLE